MVHAMRNNTPQPQLASDPTDTDLDLADVEVWHSDESLETLDQWHAYIDEVMAAQSTGPPTFHKGRTEVERREADCWERLRSVDVEEERAAFEQEAGCSWQAYPERRNSMRFVALVTAPPPRARSVRLRRAPRRRRSSAGKAARAPDGDDGGDPDPPDLVPRRAAHEAA